MRKVILIAFGVVMVLVIMLALFAGRKGGNDNSSGLKSISTDTFKEYKACDILTAYVAQIVIGPDATSSDTQASATKVGSVSVTSCSYSSVNTKNEVALLSRSALDQSAAADNKSQFSSGQSAQTQVVQGYGDAAYWDPKLGQLNILKHNNWYILTVGPAKPANRTVSQAEVFAEAVADKL